MRSAWLWMVLGFRLPPAAASPPVPAPYVIKMLRRVERALTEMQGDRGDAAEQRLCQME